MKIILYWALGSFFIFFLSPSFSYNLHYFNRNETISVDFFSSDFFSGPIFFSALNFDSSPSISIHLFVETNTKNYAIDYLCIHELIIHIVWSDSFSVRLLFFSILFARYSLCVFFFSLLHTVSIHQQKVNKILCVLYTRFFFFSVDVLCNFFFRFSSFAEILFSLLQNTMPIFSRCESKIYFKRLKKDFFLIATNRTRFFF